VANIAHEGLKLDWIEGFDPLQPSENFSPPWWTSRLDQEAPIPKLIQDWLLAGIISEVPVTEAWASASVFGVPKKDEWRLITNLKNVNPFLVTSPFTLPTLQGILPYIKKGMYGISIDLKSAYHHWPIHPRDRPFLVFEFKGRYFMHHSLPFGLAVAPREWQRAMMAVVNYCRTHGLLLWVYLDDFLLLGDSPEELLQHGQFLADLLFKLGIEINVHKSELKPVQQLRFLGFLLDLKAGAVHIPRDKLSKTVVKLAQLANSAAPTTRQVARVLGTLRSLLFALPQVRLLSDHMLYHLRAMQHFPWETQQPLSQDLLDQLESSIQVLKQWRGRHFLHDLPQEILFSDASDNGWGAVRDWQGGEPTYGWFPSHQAVEHINYKEGLATLEALRAYPLRDMEVHLYTDNTTLMWYLKKWGGRSARMNRVVKDIWDWCQTRNLFIVPHYVPSAQNPADGPSREGFHPLVESSLSPQLMLHIQQAFATTAPGLTALPFSPLWDWMASKHNAQSTLYITPEQNILTQDLTKVSPGWVNPPWHLIPHLLRYWEAQGPLAQAIALLPYKPHAPWWALFLTMQASRPLFIWNAHHHYLSEQGSPLKALHCPLLACILQGKTKPCPPAPPISPMSSITHTG
jgi:hypothetical protein